VSPGEPSAPGCVFCEIIAGHAPAHKIFEDEKSVAFLDLFPLTKGHVLVVPKTHVDRLVDLPESEYPDFLRALAVVCRRVERLSRHYNVGLNQGSLAGQIVFHLHFHVIPRYGDHNPFRSSPRVRLESEEAREVLATLAAP
jgi:histidine triad (HIT) family protein